MNLSTRQVKCSGQFLELTSTEYNLLAVLVRSAGFVVTKEILSQKALGKKLQLHDRSLDMHISNLRNKFPSDAKSCHSNSCCSNTNSTIKTIRGVGYQFITNH